VEQEASLLVAVGPGRRGAEDCSRVRETVDPSGNITLIATHIFPQPGNRLSLPVLVFAGSIPATGLF